MTDESTKNRLRLWLKSERASGLTLIGPGAFSVQVAEQGTIERHDNAMAANDPRVSARSEAPPVVTQQKAPQPLIQPVATCSQAITSNASAPFTSANLSIDERRLRLATLDEAEVRGCVKCQLCETRNHTVFGEGAVDAKLMFIGEGPGFKEDQSGRPFVGPAGELLNRMIGAMGLKREEVYIANVVKCRAFMPGPPPKDRAPAAEEIAACSGYLQQQVETIRPQVIVTLGLPATLFVLQTKSSMSRLRGQWSAWHGIKVMPTWHPSYLLRREKEGDVEPKRQAWSDLQLVMKELGLGAARK